MKILVTNLTGFVESRFYNTWGKDHGIFGLVNSMEMNHLV